MLPVRLSKQRKWGLVTHHSSGRDLVTKPRPPVTLRMEVGPRTREAGDSWSDETSRKTVRASKTGTGRLPFVWQVSCYRIETVSDVVGRGLLQNLRSWESRSDEKCRINTTRRKLHGNPGRPLLLYLSPNLPRRLRRCEDGNLVAV